MNRSLERWVSVIENAELLDPLADRLGAALAPLLAKAKVRSLLSGTDIGHPAHPVLVMAPIGTWTSAALLDLLPRRSAKAAQRLVGLGVLTALPAAAAGAADWAYTAGAERRVGLVHAAANFAALGLFTSSWLARRRGHQLRGVLLSTTATAIVSASGWLGGHLSYARGVGVDTTAFQVAPSDWVDAIALEDIGADDAAQASMTAGRPIQVRAGDVPVLLVRTGNTWTAMADRCTHRGGPLHDGSIRDGCIVCPWHDSAFSLQDGAVHVGPATRGQPMFDVRLHEGMLQLRRRSDAGTLRSSPVS